MLSGASESWLFFELFDGFLKFLRYCRVAFFFKGVYESVQQGGSGRRFHSGDPGDVLHGEEPGLYFVEHSRELKNHRISWVFDIAFAAVTKALAGWSADDDMYISNVQR